jgi:hypothetical protein
LLFDINDFLNTTMSHTPTGPAGIDDTRIKAIRPLISPALILEDYPLSGTATDTGKLWFSGIQDTYLTILYFFFNVISHRWPERRRFVKSIVMQPEKKY